MEFPQVEAEYENEWFIPDNTGLKESLRVEKDLFRGTTWLFSVNTGAVDYSTLENQRAMGDLLGNVTASAHVDYCSGWYVSFKQFYTTVHAGETTADGLVPPPLYFAWLDEFLRSDGGHQYYFSIANESALGPESIQGTQSRCTVVSRVYTGDSRVAVMDAVRDVADDYPSLDATAFTKSFVFLDGLKVMRTETISSMALAAAMVLVLCMVLIGSVGAASLVFLMVVMVDFNILACYYYSDMSYEFLTSIILVLAIGFSVDYSAHIAHAFVMSKKSTGNARATEGDLLTSVEFLCSSYYRRRSIPSLTLPLLSTVISTLNTQLPKTRIAQVRQDRP
eukprot:m.652382 g.652382  ORF g.652382 m.652382 type:complete len:336 (+) comp22689_c1_seq18:254-1261(+)